MRYKFKKRYLKWFHQFDDYEVVEPLANEDEKESIRHTMWIRIRADTIDIPPNSIKLSSWIRIAASFLLIGSMLLLMYIQQRQIANSVPVQITYTTEKGRLKKIVLQDGTEIWLNGGSQLRIPKKKAVLREVNLDYGEAFFLVKRDTTRPFIVHSGQIDTKVLGTSFNVKSLKNSKEVQVAVKTGKVELSEVSSKKNILLLPGDQARFSRLENKFIKDKLHVEHISGWTSRNFYYSGSSLAEILDDIENQYAVTFYVPDAKLLTELYTVGFEDLALKDVLHKLEIMGDLQIQTNNKMITIKKRGKR